LLKKIYVRSAHADGALLMLARPSAQYRGDCSMSEQTIACMVGALYGVVLLVAFIA
jgi:hypothetical protein